MINGKNYIYTALDEFVEVSGDTVPFVLKKDGVTVLEGVARQFPDGRNIRFYLNRLAEEYLDTTGWENLLFSTGVTKNPEAGGTFEITNADTNGSICSAYVIKDWIDCADAVLMSFYSGLEGGNALADIISGDVITGTNKIAEVLLIAVAIAVGIALPLSAFTNFMGGVL